MADQVAARLVVTGMLLEEDPETALAHALVARRLASRIPAVREAVGLAAYRAGEWQTAIAELRTYHRLTGHQTHLAVLADCERALGRPERAIDMYRAADRRKLSPAEAVELLIVAAGARSDLGQDDAAVAMLQVRELTSAEPWVARLRYAYADALLRVSRRAEARDWFARAAEADEYAETDAAERLLELDGVLLDDDTDIDDADADDADADDADVDDADFDGTDVDDTDVEDTDADDAEIDDADVEDSAADDINADADRINADADRINADVDGINADGTNSDDTGVEGFEADVADTDDALRRDPFTPLEVKRGPLHAPGDPQ